MTVVGGKEFECGCAPTLCIMFGAKPEPYVHCDSDLTDCCLVNGFSKFSLVKTLLSARDT